MEIDLSKILLLVLAVLPGFFALRARKSIVRSLHNRGATEELAEFLVYSVLVHLALAMFLLVVLAAAGFALKFDPFFFLRSWLLLPIPGAARRLLQLPAYVPLIYLPLSFACGWGMGFARGLLSVWRPLATMARWVRIRESSWVGRQWRRWFRRYLLTGRPILYDVLFPEFDVTGESKLVFVEAVLKNDEGTYIGQVKEFSLLRDEEQHKLLYMIDVYRKQTDQADYERLEVDGVLIDLGDVLTLSVRQT
jgi:hypothetical protein